MERSRAKTAPSRARRIELPTLGVAACVYGGWAALTWFHAQLPAWVLIPGAAYLLAWHGSLQHEIIHGHPTRIGWVNTLLASLPLTLWLPFGSYRTSHLLHHRDQHLTDPLEDPESYYVSSAVWAGLGPVRRGLGWANQTLLGRLVLGPVQMVVAFYADELRKLRKGDFSSGRDFAAHALGVAAVVVWVGAVCGMPLWKYLAVFVYPGLSLSLLRSFTEHRATTAIPERTAVVEAALPLGLLFLHNNLHAVHHEKPDLPWYQLPTAYRARRGDLLRANGGFYFRGYLEVAARYLLKPKDSPAHPWR